MKMLPFNNFCHYTNLIIKEVIYFLTKYQKSSTILLLVHFITLISFIITLPLS